MQDLSKKHYKKWYKHEFEMATRILGVEPVWSSNDYEVFIYKTDEVSLVFYPHKTSAGNHHIRVRDNGSKNKQKALDLMNDLYIGSGNNCTFQHKLLNINLALEHQRSRNLKCGWANNKEGK